jgi:ribosome maturation factor RimP
MAGVESIIEKVSAHAGPVIEDLGFELVDVDFLSDRGRRVLRIYVDAENGITLDDCAEVSREVGSLIDLEDLVPDEYVLEVSSPGLDRPLKKSGDFVRALGRKVKVRMRQPVDGRRRFTGTLKTFENDMLEVQIEKGTVMLPVAGIDRANLVYEF